MIGTVENYFRRSSSYLESSLFSMNWGISLSPGFQDTSRNFFRWLRAAVLGFRHGDTDYRISAFPLGGYIRWRGTLLGHVNGRTPRIHFQAQMAAVSCGFRRSAMNVILAVGLLFRGCSFMEGVPEFMSGLASVGVVEPGSPAEQAGIRNRGSVLSRTRRQENSKLAGHEDPPCKRSSGPIDSR